MAEYVFAKPYVFEGKSYEKLEYDLENLKGSDISAVKKQFIASGYSAAIIALDLDFCAMLFAKLIKQPFEFMQEMPARDYSKIGMAVSNFLVGSD